MQFHTINPLENLPGRGRIISNRISGWTLAQRIHIKRVIYPVVVSCNMCNSLGFPISKSGKLRLFCLLTENRTPKNILHPIYYIHPGPFLFMFSFYIFFLWIFCYVVVSHVRKWFWERGREEGKELNKDTEREEEVNLIKERLKYFLFYVSPFLNQI